MRSRSTDCSTPSGSIAAENAQREYYLPDLVAIYRQRGRGVETVTVAEPDEIRGINSRAELAAVSRIVRQHKNSELMAAGVTIEDPATTYIDRDVDDRRRHDHPSRRVARRPHDDRRAAARFTAASRIVDSRLGDRVTILNHCVITDSRDRQRRAASGRSRTCAPDVDVGDARARSATSSR